MSSSPTDLECGHPTLYAMDMFNQPQPWGACLLCERDSLKKALNLVEQAAAIHAERGNAQVEDSQDAARWRYAFEAMCYSFDGQNRTYYLKAIGRESFQEMVDRRRAQESAEPLCAICDHIESLHKLDFIECKHAFVPKQSTVDKKP